MIALPRTTAFIPSPSLIRFLERWRQARSNRLAASRLKYTPDHLLKDMGLTRSDIRYAELHGRWPKRRQAR